MGDFETHEIGTAQELNLLRQLLSECVEAEAWGMDLPIDVHEKMVLLKNFYANNIL